MKIGIYVGSFNPVHLGHIKIANTIIERNLVDKLLIIPTLNYWNKQDLVSQEHRISMLKPFETDRITIDSELGKYEYTYQTVEKLREKYGDVDVSLVIGADNIIKFDKWYHYEDLLKLTLIIVTREDIDVKYYLDRLNKKDGYYIERIDDEVMSASSTTVRKNLDNDMVLKRYLDPRTIKYIRDNNLYR